MGRLLLQHILHSVSHIATDGLACAACNQIYVQLCKPLSLLCDPVHVIRSRTGLHCMVPTPYIDVQSLDFDVACIL